MTVKVMNVAEKPSVAESIARILSKGNMTKRKSSSKYNPIFSFSFRYANENWFMEVTSVTGHLTDQKFPDRYKNWNTTDPQDLFHAQIITYVESTKKAVESNLKKLSKTSSVLILWLDCDREGEHISFEVIDTCKRENANIKIKRAVFSAVTENDISYAIKNLKEPNENLANSVDVRREIDLRMGAIFTRFMTIRYINLIKNGPQFISYGLCQIPTLGFVVKRYLDIQNFHREFFWTLKLQLCTALTHDGNTCNMNESQSVFFGEEGNEEMAETSDIEYFKNGKPKKGKKKRNAKQERKLTHQNTSEDKKQNKCIIDFMWSRIRLYDHLYVFLIYERLLENPLCTITNVVEKEKRKWRPLPLNTLYMTKMVSRLFKISSKDCMNIAEKLYNKGFISYPRTETNFFTSNIDLQSIIKKLQNNPTFGNYAKRLLNGEFRKPRSGKKNDQAHPPIHPVKNLYNREGIAHEEWKVYEFICRHFLAVCSDDAIGFQTKVTAKIGEETFFCSGLKIIKPNYLDIYTYDKWNDKTIPDFQVGNTFIPHKLMIEEGVTEPPSLLTESNLLTLMDRYNIGTDATMHEHIENIQKRNYAFKNEKSFFIPTNLGLALILSYRKFSDIGIDLTEPWLRARMEKDMALVAEGFKKKEEVITKYVEIMKYIYQEIFNRIEVLDQQMHCHLSKIS